MIGIGFSINAIRDDILPEVEIINIENPLYPDYLSGNYNSDIEAFLKKNYNKTIITDGAYIDLNPGTPEKEVRQIVKKKIYQSIEFAESINSTEIIFLSTFLPMIQVYFYDKSHIDHSISFWKEIMSVNKNIRVSLCNTFEYDSSVLLKIVDGVGYDKFGLAFDIGHAFAYGKISLRKFFGEVEPYCRSVYLHSNRKNADEHLNIFEGDLLTDGQFQDIIPLLKNKNVILKPFDKIRLHENINMLKKIL